MTLATYIIIGVLALLTLFALVAGIFVMAHGGELDKKWSNKLMTARVALQAAVIGLMVLLFAS